MLQTEFIRSMHVNYERVLLDKQPEEQKYQYCILSRGGIKGLLPCSLRYINGQAYLYYDITSRQNIAQLYAKHCISRVWLKDFMWSLGRIRMELNRFLLDERNVLWYPEQIYQDLESNIFSFLYVPYYDGENGFLKLLEYLVEHIDYEDDVLVECVYKMYEQCEQNGEVYLQMQIFEDAKMLHQEKEVKEKRLMDESNDSGAQLRSMERGTGKNLSKVTAQEQDPFARNGDTNKTVKKGIRSLWEKRRQKVKEEMDEYRQNMQRAMDGGAVAEETAYEAAVNEATVNKATVSKTAVNKTCANKTDVNKPAINTDIAEEPEEYGKTVYIEESGNFKEAIHRLYTPDGRIVIQLDGETCTIGKKRGEAELVLEDFSVSRIHARISKEQENMYLEDLNSTNGTYKNGLRMQPYEKRKLEEGDEIKIGKVVLIYR